MNETNIHVLLIEDNPADAALVQAEFDDLSDFCLHVRADLSAGLKALEQEPIDIILLDLNLPDADGLNGLMRLTTNHPNLPLVVLSGFGADDLLLAREAVRMGAQDFLAKGSAAAPELERIILLAIERKTLEQHRVRWSRHDPATGLPNKILIEERFPRAVSRCDRTETHLSIMMIRISGLEQVRLEHGIIVQEEALRHASQIISQHVRRNDTVGVFDDTSLIVLAECMRSQSDAYVVARKLLAQFTEPFHVKGSDVNLWLSVGIAHRDRFNESFDALLTQSVDAAIKAQNAGGRCYVGALEEAA